MQTINYDAILVLGGGIYIDGSLPVAAKRQVFRAVNLLDLNPGAAFITSGLYSYKGKEKPVISEARAYAAYAESLNVDPRSIYLEEQSQETLGNILFTKMTILIPNGWTRIIVVPQANHLTERVEYILQKVLGPGYEWAIERPDVNMDSQNIARERKSLELTRQINDAYGDGDHDAIYEGLKRTHPAYGGNLRTVDELREMLG